MTNCCLPVTTTTTTTFLGEVPGVIVADRLCLSFPGCSCNNDCDCTNAILLSDNSNLEPREVLAPPYCKDYWQEILMIALLSLLIAIPLGTCLFKQRWVLGKDRGEMEKRCKNPNCNGREGGKGAIYTPEDKFCRHCGTKRYAKSNYEEGWIMAGTSAGQDDGVNVNKTAANVEFHNHQNNGVYRMMTGVSAGVFRDMGDGATVVAKDPYGSVPHSHMAKPVGRVVGLATKYGFNVPRVAFVNWLLQGILTFIIVHLIVFPLWVILMDLIGVHGEPWNAINLGWLTSPIFLMTDSHPNEVAFSKECPFSLLSIWLALWVSLWFGHLWLWVYRVEWHERSFASIAEVAEGAMMETAEGQTGGGGDFYGSSAGGIVGFLMGGRGT